LRNLKKVLRILENIRKECEKLTGDEIEKAIPKDSQKAVEAFYKMGKEIHFIFGILSPLREVIISRRIKLESQLKNEDPS
jgi:hypothetical protein